jgi:hypothetical protein
MEHDPDLDRQALKQVIGLLEAAVAVLEDRSGINDGTSLPNSEVEAHEPRNKKDS